MMSRLETEFPHRFFSRIWKTHVWQRRIRFKDLKNSSSSVSPLLCRQQLVLLFCWNFPCWICMHAKATARQLLRKILPLGSCLERFYLPLFCFYVSDFFFVGRMCQVFNKVSCFFVLFFCIFEISTWYASCQWHKNKKGLPIWKIFTYDAKCHGPLLLIQGSCHISSVSIIFILIGENLCIYMKGICDIESIKWSLP